MTIAVPQRVLVEVCGDLDRQFAGVLAPAVIRRCAAATIADLQGSISDDVLADMAAQLARVRLARWRTRAQRSG
jgi:hypothetical protein